MKAWHVRVGSPRNRFQALLCWCLGWDVYFGETPPWKQAKPEDIRREAQAEAEKYVARPAGPPIPKEHPGY